MLFRSFAQKGYDSQATSGYRPGATTSQGKESRHSAGQAMDVVFPALGGSAYQTLLKDPEVAAYLMQNDITAIDEYDPTVQQATGATGPHIHFGFDKGTKLSDKFRTDATALYPNISVGGGNQQFQTVKDIAGYYRNLGYTGGEKIGRAHV